MARKHIYPLTSLRFVAASMIVVHHTKGVLWLPKDSLEFLILDQGVSFFFVLSGFILTYVYPTLKGGPGIKRFYLARLARIWPAHLTAFLCLLVLFLPASLNLLTTRDNAAIAFMNVLMVHGWIPIQKIFFSFNSVSWTISTESFFYLVFPLLIRDFETTWLRKLVFSFLVMVGLIILSSLLQIPPDASAEPYGVSVGGVVFVNPMARLFEFVLGMCTALLWRKVSLRFIPGRNVFSFVELLAICFVIGTIYLSTFVYVSEWTRGAALQSYIHHAGSSLSFAALVFVMAMESGRISQLLSCRVFVFLGEISYSIYLFHYILLYFFVRKIKNFSGLPDPYLYAAFWGLLLVIATLVWLIVERPSRRFLVGLYRSN